MINWNAIGVGAAISLSAGMAHAGDWVLASIGDDEVRAVDLSSLRTGYPNTVKTGWMVTVHLGSKTIDSREYDYVLNRISVDCRNDTIALSMEVIYSLYESDAIHTSQFPARAMPVVPDTVGENVRDLVCDEAAELMGTGNETVSDFAFRARQIMILGGDDPLAAEAVRNAVENANAAAQTAVDALIAADVETDMQATEVPDQ